MGKKTSHHDLNIVGYRRATYICTKRGKYVNISYPSKQNIIMNCSLKFDYMKKELLVIVCNHSTVDLISDRY